MRNVRPDRTEVALLKGLFGRKEATEWKWIEAEELEAALNSEAPPILVDVRGPDEFTGPLGHIEGARNVPLDRVPAATAELLGIGRPVVLVCHTDRRSAAGAALLARAGGTDVAVLRGGMVGWRASGR